MSPKFYKSELRIIISETIITFSYYAINFRIIIKQDCEDFVINPKGVDGMIKERVIDKRQYDCFGDNLKVHSSLKKKERSAKNQRKANTK